MISCWIESFPMNWVFALTSCDLLLDWITSCELAFSLDFPWFTVELNHILQIGFFSLDFPWFTVGLNHIPWIGFCHDLLLDWITSCELGFSLDFLSFTVGLNHFLWIRIFPWFPMIYCWIEPHPMNWVVPLISHDLLLNWITSCELNFFLQFPVGLNHIPWIGFFLYFPVWLNCILWILFFPWIGDFPLD